MLEPSQRQISKEIPRMTLVSIIFKAVVGKVSMRGQRYKADCNACHEEDRPLRQCKYIFFNSSSSRLSFLIFYLLNAKYFFDRCHNMSKNIIFRNDIRISLRSIDNNKLIMIFIIPNDPINSISDQLNMMIRLGSWEEKIDLTILML